MLLGPCLFLGKSCLLLLYHRIFNIQRAFHLTIYIFIAFAFVSQMSIIPMDAILCHPVNDWTMENPRCQETYKIGPAQGACSIAIDVAIFVMPIPIVWGLHMPIRRRIGVLAIFATGAMYGNLGFSKRISNGAEDVLTPCVAVQSWLAPSPSTSESKCCTIPIAGGQDI